jgi:hypothetical protein
MTIDGAVEYVPATPEYVLEVFRDVLRQGVALGDADPDVVLSMDTTVGEWRDAELEDFVDWRYLARGLNEYWSIDIPLETWHETLKPFGKRTLGDVCCLVARHATRPQMREVTVFGSTCRAAGAFLAVRQLLMEGGADVRQLAPSSDLADYMIQYRQTFSHKLPLLSPGRLPALSIDHPSNRLGGALGIICALMIALGGFFSAPWITIWGVAGYAFHLLYVHVLARHVPPSRVEYEGLTTFRDLASALAGPARQQSRC